MLLIFGHMQNFLFSLPIFHCLCFTYYSFLGICKIFLSLCPFSITSASLPALFWAYTGFFALYAHFSLSLLHFLLLFGHIRNFLLPLPIFHRLCFTSLHSLLLFGHIQDFLPSMPILHFLCFTSCSVLGIYRFFCPHCPFSTSYASPQHYKLRFLRNGRKHPIKNRIGKLSYFHKIIKLALQIPCLHMLRIVYLLHYRQYSRLI